MAYLPLPVVRRLVPGFCRNALEAAFIRVIRRPRLAAGTPHADVEEELTSLTKVTPLAAVAFFNDREKGSDVMARLNRFRPMGGRRF